MEGGSMRNTKNMSSDPRPQLEKKALLDSLIKDHELWTKQLNTAIDKVDYKIKIELDHRKCPLGKWCSTYEPQDKEKTLFSKIENPHKQIHSTGIKILQELSLGNKGKARNMFDKDVNNYMSQIKNIFEELKTL